MVKTDDNPAKCRDNLDLSYALFGRLQGGEQVVVVKNDLKYYLAFRGDGFGGENFLEVASELGVRRKYGWGCYPEQILQALEEMDAGWDQPQRYPCRPLQKPREVEVV